MLSAYGNLGICNILSLLFLLYTLLKNLDIPVHCLSQNIEEKIHPSLCWWIIQGFWWSSTNRFLLWVHYFAYSDLRFDILIALKMGNPLSWPLTSYQNKLTSCLHFWPIPFPLNHLVGHHNHLKQWTLLCIFQLHFFFSILSNLLFVSLSFLFFVLNKEVCELLSLRTPLL